MPKRETISAATALVAVAVQAITVGRPSRSAICGQAQVVGAEVVAPLRDAVRLVDREQVDAPLRERLEEDVRAEALRRAVDDPRRPAANLLEGPPRRLGAHPRGDHRHRVTGCGEPLPLVVHQRDQRADDDRQVLAGQPRQLVAEALAAAGGHHDQRVAALQRGFHRLALTWPEGGEAELAEQLDRRAGWRSASRAGYAGWWTGKRAICDDFDKEARSNRSRGVTRW